LRSSRITGSELAARNRRADFPASQRVARSRRPQPSSTGTSRQGSAQQSRCDIDPILPDNIRDVALKADLLAEMCEPFLLSQ
jgi:hypothetical protein